jgi:hypothetical protein
MPLPLRNTSGPFNPEIERLLYQLKVVREDALGLIAGLSDQQLHWTPDPVRWSMAQCYEHLLASNKKFLVQFRGAIAEARRRGILHDGPYVYGLIARWFLRLLEPPVKRRFKAPSALQPGPRRSGDELRKDWIHTYDELAEVYRSASGVDLARVKITSPASSLVRYSLGAGFWIQTAHDRRHVWQAREVRNSAGFPAGTATPAAHS